MTEQQPTPAEIRLAQYGDRTSAIYGSGTEKALHRIALDLKAELDRVRGQRKFLVEQIARKDAESGSGDRALADFLGGEPGEPKRHLEDGSTHTVQAIQDAGEACVQRQCRAAREVAELEQAAYVARGHVQSALEELGYLIDDGVITVDKAAGLRRTLHDALGLRTA